MDRERLKEVHKTETTESRVNEDFIDWLKNKGPTWLLVVLVAFTAYLGLVRWRASKQVAHVQAWQALGEAERAAFPASLVSVAEDYPRTDAIAVLARLHAAQLLLDAVLTGRTPGAAFEEDPQPMTEQDREQNLARADALYRDVIAADDNTLRMALHAINAHNGRAAVAEARGDLEEARRHYTAAAQRAETVYPHLAQQARQRAEGESILLNVVLPSEEDVPTPADADALRPARIDPSLHPLLMPVR